MIILLNNNGFEWENQWFYTGYKRWINSIASRINDMSVLGTRSRIGFIRYNRDVSEQWTLKDNFDHATLQSKLKIPYWRTESIQGARYVVLIIIYQLCRYVNTSIGLKLAARYPIDCIQTDSADLNE